MTGPAPIDFTDRIAVVTGVDRGPGRVYALERAGRGAAAKAGLVGLCDVLAIEGPPHGILADSVLAFGTSRRVTETVPDEEELERSRFLNAMARLGVTPEGAPTSAFRQSGWLGTPSNSGSVGPTVAQPSSLITRCGAKTER